MSAQPLRAHDLPRYETRGSYVRRTPAPPKAQPAQQPPGARLRMYGYHYEPGEIVRAMQTAIAREGRPR